MKPFISRVAIIAFAIAIACSGNAFAWGEDGHRSVCEIAFQLLDPAHQNEVKRLIAAYDRPDGGKINSFADACVMPDEARANARKNLPDWTRFNQFNDWHFLNVPRTRVVIEQADCKNDCVLEGIAFHSKALHDADNDHDRAEALLFLGHWVGDVHQPLHVSFEDDQGGNLIKPIKGGFYNSPTDKFPLNLHSVWDSRIIGKAKGQAGWRDYADRLAKQITPVTQALWLTTEPLEWAQESYALTTLAAVDYCQWDFETSGPQCESEPQTRMLKAAYQALFQDEVETRLEQAGVRLADQIRKNLVVE
jgi:hypothetical protein